MIKKVPVEDLLPGMYVADLGSKPVAARVIRDTGVIADAATIAEMRRLALAYVYIDTDRGLDVAPAVPGREAAQGPLVAEAAGFEDAMLHARAVRAAAVHTLGAVMRDVKLGNAIDVPAVETVVDQVIGSVFRDASALLCLGMIRDKDSYLMEHSINTAVLITVLARFIGTDVDYIRQMAIGALLHDLGKVHIPAAILHKPGRLSPGEFAVIQRHAEYGRKVLEGTPGIDPIAVEMAGQHHEREDGKGYPAGLKGAAIPPHSKMLGIIDVYDALTADRCYHNRMTPHEAMRRLHAWAGSHFDRYLTLAFIKSLGIYPVGATVLLASGKVGVVIATSRENSLQPRVKVFYDMLRRCQIAKTVLDLSGGYTDKIVDNIDPRNLQIDIAAVL